MSAPIISPQLLQAAAPAQMPNATAPAAPRPAKAPAEALPPAARVSAPSTTRSRTQTMQIKVKRGPDRVSTVLLVLGISMLVLALVGLVLKTPLGVTLGLRKAAIGAIEVRTSPVLDATVKLDGVIQGRAPLRLEVSAGARRIEVEAAGYAKAGRDVALSADTTALVDIVLTPLSNATPTPTQATPPAAP
jgi:hypothetical protein